MRKVKRQKIVCPGCVRMYAEILSLREKLNKAEQRLKAVQYMTGSTILTEEATDFLSIGIDEAQEIARELSGGTR